MRQASILATVTALVLHVGSPASSFAQNVRLRGSLFGRPLEVVTQQADLIVVGKVVAIGRAQPLSYTPRSAVKPVTRFYSPCTVLVSRVIKSAAGGAKPKLSAGGRMGLKALALPDEKSGGARRCVLAEGARYVLMVRRLRETNGWILPYGRDYYTTPTDKTTAAVVKATRLEGWPWGPARDGLQVAMICKWTRWTHMIRDRQTIFFRTYVALRNTSQRAVTVNLRPADAPVWVEARNADGVVVTGDVYRSLRWRLRGEWPTPAEPLAPGQVIFVGQTGRRAVQLEASLDLPAGEWTIHAGYRNARARTEDGRALWTGRVAAKPLAIKVAKKRPK